MRCLTLARVLEKKEKANIIFICQESPGHLCDYLIDMGYQVYRVPELLLKNKKNILLDAEQVSIVIKKFEHIDWIVVDHYLLDSYWEAHILENTQIRRVMVIDDLANRAHLCQIVLDQNYYENIQERYRQLVPNSCVQLLGPSYALLRPEFAEQKKKANRCIEKVNRILLFFGGSDPTNETLKALLALELLAEDIKWKEKQAPVLVDVIVGSSNPNKYHIAKKCMLLNKKIKKQFCFFYHCQVENMAEFMARADLSVGAGGTATWERCYLGLPSLVVAVAENQMETTRAVAKTGAIRFLGWHEDVKEENIADEVLSLLQDPSELQELTQASWRLMDKFESNKTGTERVVQIMKEVVL